MAEMLQLAFEQDFVGPPTLPQRRRSRSTRPFTKRSKGLRSRSRLPKGSGSSSRGLYKGSRSRRPRRKADLKARTGTRWRWSPTRPPSPKRCGDRWGGTSFSNWSPPSPKASGACRPPSSAAPAPPKRSRTRGRRDRRGGTSSSSPPSPALAGHPSARRQHFLSAVGQEAEGITHEGPSTPKASGACQPPSQESAPKAQGAS